MTAARARAARSRSRRAPSATAPRSRARSPRRLRQDGEAEPNTEREASDEGPETGDGDQPTRPDIKDPGAPEPPYKVFTKQFDEVVDAEELCEPRS